MSADIGWLPAGALLLVAIGLIIRARLRVRSDFGQQHRPKWMPWFKKLGQWISSATPTLWLLALGFMLGSSAVFWLALLGVDMCDTVFILPSLRRQP